MSRIIRKARPTDVAEKNIPYLSFLVPFRQSLDMVL